MPRDRLIDKLNKFHDINVPFDVKACFYSCSDKITYGSSGDVSLGGDYKTVPEIGKALEWYVNQLGGEITWEK